MIKREISKTLKELCKKYPVISVTGPRQSGKTTLIQNLFQHKPYISLEDPDERLFALNDPRGFLNRFADGVILDEVQRVPDLFSYIQTIVDARKKNGMFILSGSQNFLLLEKISQSLAGRVAILKLLPLSIIEMKKHGILQENIIELLHSGSYPGLYSNKIESGFFFPNYIQTYVERDIRSIKQIGDLNSFTRFMQLCAGRIGQLLNISSIANDCGIAVNTAKSWISILESSYTVFLLQPHYSNFNKRIVKSPKLYFYDTGLAASLLKIENKSQMLSHYLLGGLFENLIIIDLLKNRFNKGLTSNLYFWRDNKGVEIDCIVEKANNLIPIEIKSSQTYNIDFFKNINFWNSISGNSPENSFVIYGGDKSMKTKDGNILSWKSIEKELMYLLK